MKMKPTAVLANRTSPPYNGVVATLTLEYWTHGGWYVGRLREVPEALSQGKTLGELRRNIKDAYALLMADRPSPPRPAKTKPIRIG